MVLPEIDSFVFKFKNLLHLEKDATLTLKSEAGKASVTLSVELGHVLSDSLLRNPRNGPARQRRRERRAAARDAEKESSKQEVVKKVDTVEKDTLTEEVEDQTTTANVHETEKESNDAEKVVDHPTAGATSNAATNRLIMKLDKKETLPVVMGPPSPIVQLDGQGEEEVIKYSFESTYHEDDINECLSEIFNEHEINFALESRVKVAPLSNREIFVIRLKPTDAFKKSVSWPHMEKDQADVFENVKRLK